MWNLFKSEEKEKENFYNNRDHQDTFYDFNSNTQYCDHCNRSTEFQYDRCTRCGNN